jgi:hypothetical protein
MGVEEKLAFVGLEVARTDEFRSLDGFQMSAQASKSGPTMSVWSTTVPRMNPSADGTATSGGISRATALPCFVISTLTRSSRTLSISARHVSLNTPAPTSIVFDGAEGGRASNNLRELFASGGIKGSRENSHNITAIAIINWPSFHFNPTRSGVGRGGGGGGWRRSRNAGRPADNPGTLCAVSEE